jgi:Na+-driven multidrug efflux pump
LGRKKLKKKIINDYTTGSIPSQLIRFSIPFMLSNALQVLYSLVDMIVVGQFVGSYGLSAVSIASSIFMFMTMLCIGFSNGGQVYIAQIIGAGSRKELNRAIGTLFTNL